MKSRLGPCLSLLQIVLMFAAAAAFAGEKQCEWTNVARIVAVGDVHGDCDQMIKCLRNAGVIDNDNRWIGGKTHLVQTGDILDRGPDSKKAMDLLMELEPAAEKAGGKVHALIGNHEAMILAGHYTFLHPDETAPYGGKDEFTKAMSRDGKYGKWIRGHNAIIRINDILFVHGGISASMSTMTLQEINAQITSSLGEDKPNEAGDSMGILWNRNLAIGDEAMLDELLGPVFRKYSAKHVVVGHTVVSPDPRIKARANGAVIMIDVGMSKTYGNGPAMCLLVDDGKFYAVTSAGKEPLP